MDPLQGAESSGKRRSRKDQVPYYSGKDYNGKLGECLKSCRMGKHQPVNVNTFNPAEVEQSLSIPTSQILERHDYRTILDFHLMKLRTALDRD